MTGRGRADSALAVQTPEGIEYVLYPAGPVMRACAWAIDFFIQGAVLVGIIFVAGILSSVMGSWIMLLLFFALDWFYHATFEVLCRGQSPGKKFMGIRVLRSDGSPVNPGASFLRNLLRFADTFMFLYLVAFVSMMVSPGFRRFGDWAADTLVVYTANARTPGRFTSPALRRTAMPWLADVPMITPPRKLEYGEKQAVLMFARRYPLLGRARADEIAGEWVKGLRNGGGFESGGRGSGVSASTYLLGIAHTLSG